MQYRILGPLEVAPGDGAPVDLGTPKQRAVLATLVLEPGRVVSAERIAAHVWGEEPPTSVAASLQAYVSNLRRVLRDDDATSAIVRQSPGYRLDVATSALDSGQFTAAADAARAAVERHDWVGALHTVQPALALWRGEVLADFGDEEWVRVAATPLNERRAGCAEDLVTALLGLNRTDEAANTARELYAANSLRERAGWLYIVALHRDGRTTDALAELRALIRRLDDELGLDPSPLLRDLQGAMLRHDSDLAAWPNTAGPVTSDSATPHPPANGIEPSPALDPNGSALIGRGAQLRLLERAFGEALAGSVRWAVLSGPAGIGKTRLAEEVLSHAADRGARVVRCACPDDEGLPPWWPITQLIRSLGEDPVELLVQDPAAEADRARFAVYERVRTLIDTVATGEPIIILIDDVQWADPSSLGLLAYLTFGLELRRVMVVLTARGGVMTADLRRLLDSVARRPAACSVSVPPLGGPEVGELVRRVSGDHMAENEVAELLTRTGGNPFFVTEYARLPRGERVAGGIPLAVRSVLGRRLEGLDAGTLTVLRTAAVIGDTLDIALLRRVTRLSVDELADLLDEAADERIVVIAPGTRTYTFGHGLLRDELLAGMNDTRRQRIHARVAEAIAVDGDGEQLARRAAHLLAAVPLVDATDALEACRAAALDADAGQFVDSAAYWWDAAISCLDQLPSRSLGERDDMVRRRLTALIRAGRGQTVYDVVDAEVTAALDGGRSNTIGRLCSILIRSCGAWPWAASGEDPGPLLARLQSAATLIADDQAAHARVLAALSVGSVYSADATTSDRLSAQALTIAEQLADADVLADALLARCLAFSGVAARCRDSQDLLTRLAGLPHEFAEVDAVIAHGILTMVHEHLGEIDIVREHIRLGVAGSDALRLPTCRVQFRLVESALALWEGRFAEAERLYVDGMRLHQQTELYLGLFDISLIVSRWKQGRLLSLADEPTNGDLDLLRAICLDLARGEITAADAGVQQLLDEPAPLTWFSLGQWALLAALVADARLVCHARRLIDLLTPYAGLIAIFGMLTSVGPVSLCIARLHFALGEHDEARPHLAEAEELCRRSGGLPSLLRCRLLRAELGDASAEELINLIDEAAREGIVGIEHEARVLLARGPVTAPR